MQVGAVNDFHFAMVNDFDRNEFYKTAPFARFVVVITANQNKAKQTKQYILSLLLAGMQRESRSEREGDKTTCRRRSRHWKTARVAIKLPSMLAFWHQSQTDRNSEASRSLHSRLAFLN